MKKNYRTELNLKGFLCLLFCLSFISGCEAQKEEFSTQHLFEARTGNYHTYRIPGIIVTQKGTLIVWAEARKGISDWEEIALVSRRSTDGGKTWSKTSILQQSKKSDKLGSGEKESEEEKKEKTIGNGVMIPDKEGNIHFLFCQGYQKVFYSKSVDDGLSFDTPKEITHIFDDHRKDYPFRAVATGPGHGIQMKSGRLLVPVWMSTGELVGGHRPSRTTTIYSDDLGNTWKAGEVALYNRKPHFNDEGQPSAVLHPSEMMPVELADGRVMMNARSESAVQRRVVTYSNNGISNWSIPKFDGALFDPICFGSIVRFTDKNSSSENRILFVNPDSKDRGLLWGERRRRENLTVRLSYDEGETWPVSKVLDSEMSAYADIAVGPNKSIFILYEDGGVGDNAFDVQYLTLAKFNLEWLTDGKDKIRTK